MKFESRIPNYENETIFYSQSAENSESTEQPKIQTQNDDLKYVAI